MGCGVSTRQRGEQVVSESLAKVVPCDAAPNSLDAFTAKEAKTAKNVDCIEAKCEDLKAVSEPASGRANAAEDEQGALSEPAFKSTQDSKEVAPTACISTQIPELPQGYLLRPDMLDSIKQGLMLTRVDVGVAPALALHGMGGSGKTVIASAILRDNTILKHFSKIAFLAVGQQPDLFEMRRSLHLQLSGKMLDPAVTEEAAVMQALQRAAAGTNILICIDDAWDAGQIHALNCVDPQTTSRLLVTTRIHRLLPGIVEIPLALLDRDDAVSLMLEVAGVRGNLPFREIEHEAAEACGRLPLVLTVAGSMLEQYGGCIDEQFLKILSEDHGEVMREGEFGDEHVNVEDRIITASLNSFQGADKDLVKQLFVSFGIFPEDARIPAALFDTFATSMFGASGKRAVMQVRGWITSLLRLSLLQGSLATGLYQHDIIRHYCISRSNDLRANQRQFVQEVLAAKPACGEWTRAELTTVGSLEHYVATSFWWHVRGALANGTEDEELLDQLASSDAALVDACAVGVGYEALLTHADNAEASGKTARAARILAAATTLGVSGRMSQQVEKTVLIRAQKLLEALDDEALSEVEIGVLTRLRHFSMTEQEMVVKLNMRILELCRRRRSSKPDTWQLCMAEGFTLVNQCHSLTRMFYGKIQTRSTREEMEEFLELVPEIARCAVRGAELVPQDNPNQKKIFLHILAPSMFGVYWSIGARKFMASGTLEQLGAPGVWLQAWQDYDLETSGFRNNPVNIDFVLVGIEVVPVLLCYGHVQRVQEWVVKMTAVHKNMSSERVAQYAPERGFLWLVTLPVLVVLGLRRMLRPLLCHLRMHSWDGPGSESALGGLASWAPAFGSPDVIVLFINLQIFLIMGPKSGCSDAASAAIKCRDFVMEASDYYFFRNGMIVSPAELAALVAEMLGDDILAEWYAARALDLCVRSTGRCLMLQLQGRIASRRGDRVAAIDLWQASAHLAIQEHVPLLALCAALDCGSEEGERMAEAACVSIGRPLEEVRLELREAKEEEPEVEPEGKPVELSMQHNASVSSLMPIGSSVQGLQSASRLQEAVTHGIDIMTYNVVQEKYIFTPPAAHELALSTVAQLNDVREELMARTSLEGAERLILKKFLDDDVRPFLELYIHKAQEPATTERLREHAARVSSRFKNIYLDTLQRTKEDDPHGEKAFVSMASLLVRHCQTVTDRAMRVHQETVNIVELFHHAIKPHFMLQDFCSKIAAAGGGAVAQGHDGQPVQMKQFWRAMEKAAFESNPERRWDANRICDVARSGIAFSDYSSMERAIEAICTSELVEVVRIKDRISSVLKATSLGWTDVMINLRFRSDANRHICEVQLFHETSMKCRSTLGGHKEYVQFRTIAELFEASGMVLL